MGFEQARTAQRKTTKYLRKQNKKLRNQLNEQQEKLGSMAGQTPAEATQNFSQDFYNTISNIGKQYSEQLSNYNPNLLASESAKRFAGALSSSMNDYTTRLNQASQAGSARLYAALSAPISKFQQIANDPAFNNLLDSTYMAYATNPPTVRSDVESMKSLYTYNV
jgi:hypothetical protein